MIDLLASTHSEASALVLAALRRSVSRTQARQISLAFCGSSTARILIVVQPDASHVSKIQEWKRQGAGKLLLFGALPGELADALGLECSEWPDGDWSRSRPALAHGCAESAGRIVYTPNAVPLKAGHWRRPLERFDFTDEWNNLGYGAIRRDASPWSLAQPLVARDGGALASVEVDGKCIATYALIRDEPSCSTFWFNRAVGPIDSFEWRSVEYFLASWRHGELPCQPILSDIPFGCDAAVTMRLDCDEDIESSRLLREVYHALGVPFSLAVHTSNLLDPAQHVLLKEMASLGESILSHTATHAPNWGGSYQTALSEGRESVALLKAVTGRRVRYAVSPFHQTPQYALQGLADAGFAGCIGGIIRNDPEFLLARGGGLAALPDGFIGHSQQHMLHGDCMLATEDPLAISKKAFDTAHETRTLFGYLDHPFSSRYQYGWSSESARIEAHRSLIEYIRRQAPSVLFMSEEDAMDFLLMKSEWQVISDGDGFAFIPPGSAPHSLLKPAVEYADGVFEAVMGSFSA